MSSLSVKYRPKSFSDVIGQSSTVMILKKQIQTEKIKNCLIFSGSSGCGKTTLARIFAKEVNGSDNSAIEIDAASNNGVENIRNIVNSANERSINSKYKIFIMDEAHMLTTAAWNALLKTVEEPPKYTIFIFCTTNPEKIPDTIKNRCQRFNFTKIPSTLINERLKYICCQEGFTNFEDSCDYISKNCKNQMRDAISLLEQSAELSTNLDIKTTIELLGGNNISYLFSIINAIIDGNQAQLISDINTLFLNSIDVKSVVNSLISLELDINKYIIFHNMDHIKVSSYYENNIKNSINFDNSEKYHSYILNNLLDMLKITELNETTIVAYLIKISRFC